MPRIFSGLLLASVLAHGWISPSAAAELPDQAHALPAQTHTVAQTQMRPAARPPEPGIATVSQPVTVQAGTGVLLRLPSPAATVMSADPGVARVQPASPTSLFLMGVSPGQTTVIATSDAGVAIVQYDVSVSPGGRAAAAAAVPGAGASAPAAAPAGVSAATALAIQSTIAQTVIGASGVRVRPAGSDVILAGTVPNALAAQQAEAIARAYVGEKAGVVDSLTVLGSIQVNVRVRIAEVNRQITRQLGFNWQALGSGTGWRFGLRTGAAVTNAVTTPLLPLGLASLAGASAAPNQLGAGFTSGGWDVNNVIDALAEDQLITILAEPNLTALSGETASFLAGGEFPIPVSGNASNGATTISVSFKEYGISLAFVPTVLSPTRLNLRVRPEVSQLSNNGAVSLPVAGGVLAIPALTVRRAETTVEIGSGQSFAIAGLLEKSSTDVTDALPGIGELPVVGALFKSNNFQRGESELVIIVTPYLVQPVDNPADLHAPTDHFRPATDLDRILYGRQLAPPRPGAAPVDAGFILK
jgi:pilus assembly protein CpaC